MMLCGFGIIQFPCRNCNKSLYCKKKHMLHSRNILNSYNVFNKNKLMSIFNILYKLRIVTFLLRCAQMSCAEPILNLTHAPVEAPVVENNNRLL